MATNSLRDWYDDASVVAIVLMVLIVAFILDGAFFLQELLAVVTLVAPAVAIYLLWRLVVATERVAEATEMLAAEGLTAQGSDDD